MTMEYTRMKFVIVDVCIERTEQQFEIRYLVCVSMKLAYVVSGCASISRYFEMRYFDVRS